VIGIRMVAEWFVPRNRLGRRHLWRLGQRWLCDCCLTLYCAATAFLAVGQINWRFAIALTGMVAAVYGVIYFSASKTRLLAKFTSDPPAAKGWK